MKAIEIGCLPQEYFGKHNPKKKRPSFMPSSNNETDDLEITAEAYAFHEPKSKVPREEKISEPDEQRESLSDRKINYGELGNKIDDSESHVSTDNDNPVLDLNLKEEAEAQQNNECILIDDGETPNVVQSSEKPLTHHNSSVSSLKRIITQSVDHEVFRQIRNIFLSLITL